MCSSRLRENSPLYMWNPHVSDKKYFSSFLLSPSCIPLLLTERGARVATTRQWLPAYMQDTVELRLPAQHRARVAAPLEMCVRRVAQQGCWLPVRCKASCGGGLPCLAGEAQRQYACWAQDAVRGERRKVFEKIHRFFLFSLTKRDMLLLGLSLISSIISYRERVSHVFLMRWGALTPRHTFDF